jgi:hypothetical protein
MSALVERSSDTVAKVQDLSDEFVNAKSFEFPFTSRVRKAKAPVAVYATYAVEKYDGPKTTGAVDEADPTEYENPRKDDAELQARVHVFERAVRIGGLATTVTHQAGVTPKNVIAKAVAKKLIELKRDNEVVYLGDGESRADDGVRGNETRGLVKWAQATAQTHYPVPTNYLTPSGSIDSSTALADYTDDTITAIAQSQFDEHGNTTTENVIFAGSRWKRNLSRITFYTRNVSNMTCVRQFNQNVSDKVVMGKVDMLETDFGNYDVVLSQHINASGDPTTAASKRLAVATPMEYVELRSAEKPNMVPLAKTGRSEKFLVTNTAMLAHLNPRVLAKWAPGS